MYLLHCTVQLALMRRLIKKGLANWFTLKWVKKEGWWLRNKTRWDHLFFKVAFVFWFYGIFKFWTLSRPIASVLMYSSGFLRMPQSLTKSSSWFDTYWRGLNLRKFFTLAHISKKRAKCTILSTIHLKWRSWG